MKPIKKLRKNLQGRFDERKPKRPYYPALLGDGNGVVEVSGRPGWVYVRTGATDLPGQAFNEKVPNVDNLAVIVGYDDINPTLFQVLSIRHVYEDAGLENYAGVPTHATTHEWSASTLPGRTDVVFVHMRQWLPLMVSVSSGFILTIQDGYLYRGGAFEYIAVQTVDLTAYIPAGHHDARFMLVYLDGAGVLSATPGAVVSPITHLSITDCPTPTASDMPLAAVRLHGQQTSIDDSPASYDIVDLRFPQTTPAGNMVNDFSMHEIYELETEFTHHQVSGG